MSSERHCLPLNRFERCECAQHKYGRCTFRPDLVTAASIDSAKNRRCADPSRLNFTITAPRLILASASRSCGVITALMYSRSDAIDNPRISNTDSSNGAAGWRCHISAAVGADERAACSSDTTGASSSG